MPVEILYDDADVLAVAKPSGQLVIPGRGDLPGIPLLHELEKQAGQKLYVIHRLDRGASGIVLLARTPQAHRFLSMQFEQREVRKSYQVLAQGLLESGGRIDQPIRAFGSGRMGVDARGKVSVTEYAIRRAFSASTLLDVFPQTGRRHQIRVHLFSIGHPVMGDPLYGKDRPVGGSARLMLHAYALEFRHPNGNAIALKAGPPPDFQSGLPA